MFGADNLSAFLKLNDMASMVRSHSIVPTGIESFSDNLISITSCTNASGTHQNDGCFLVVQKQMIVNPKIIKTQKDTAGHWQVITKDSVPSSANSSVRRDPTPPRKAQGVEWLGESAKK